MRRCEDEALSALLMQCLAVDPEDRPAGMDEVARRLAEIAERGAGTGTPAPSGRELGRQLVAGAKKRDKKPKKRAPAARKAPDARRGGTSSPTLARLRERRTVIWLTLTAAAALAAAAFLFGDAITG